MRHTRGVGRFKLRQKISNKRALTLERLPATTLRTGKKCQALEKMYVLFIL